MENYAVIIPYFGKFKPSADLFFESCRRNPKIDWIIFSDNDFGLSHISESNIHYHHMKFSDFLRRTERKLNTTLSWDRPYKLCDLKPFYGAIFDDYLVDYSYWGYGDMDVIYGDVSGFLTKIHASDYDKINWMGHLTFIRNTERCVNAVFHNCAGTKDAFDVLATEKNCGFDERDYNKKLIDQGLRIYTGPWAADIDIFYWRMRCVDINTLHCLLDSKEITYAPKNSAKQLFAVIQGKVYRVFLKTGRVEREEFAYIHFRREVPIHLECLQDDTFIISRNGFEPVDGGPAAFSDYKTVKQLITKHNNQQNSLQECGNFLWQYYRKISGKRGW